MGHRSAVYALSGYNNANFFLSGAGDGWTVVWDVENPETGRLLAETEGNIFSLCYLPDLHWLLVGNMQGAVHWVDLLKQQTIKTVLMHPKGVFDIQLIDNKIWSVGADGCLTVWDIAQMRPLETLQLSSRSLRAIAVCVARREVAVAASDASIYILDMDNLLLKQQIAQAHTPSVFSVAYSLDGRWLLSGGRDAQICIWDTNDGYALYHKIPAHLYTVNHLAVHPSGAFFASASRDRSIKFWQMQEGFPLLKVIEKSKGMGHLQSVNRLFWLNDTQLLSASDDKTIALWEVVSR